MKKYKPEEFDSFAEEYEKFVSYFLGNPYFGWDDLSGDNAIDMISLGMKKLMKKLLGHGIKNCL